MIEVFAKPAVGAIIEKEDGKNKLILIQERQKESGGTDNGLLEIPAGKIREYENIFAGLRREVWEETGLTITEIMGEQDAIVSNVGEYQTISFLPFFSTQNITGGYSIMLQTFICQAEGDLLTETNESINLRWMSLDECRSILSQNPELFYPMHINALRKYLALQEDSQSTI